MRLMRPNLEEARSKIVATVGPACADTEVLADLIRHGADVLRINTAHGGQSDFEEWLERIAKVREQTGFPVAILLDLAGPKIRLGQLSQEALAVEPGMELKLIRGERSSSADELCSNYARLIDELNLDDRVMLADGTITLQVIDKQAEVVLCRCLSTGTVRSRQGINLPGVSLSVDAMRPEDYENARWAAHHDIDFVSLSFVRTPQDVAALKKLLADEGSSALVIAKIEKREALDVLDAIVETADGVMVARGDLGVEIDVAETPAAQKRIIDVCRRKMKPVIVATQMLESMHTSRRPTRAEASDVANAILDGADACMLSGETAIGDYPVQAVDTMNRIMVHTEQTLIRPAPIPVHQQPFDPIDPITSAVTYHASSIAEDIQAKLVVVVSRSGNTAWVKSKQRSFTATLGISDERATLRRMCLFWGIMPHQVADLSNPQSLFENVTEWGKQQDVLVSGDRVVFVTGTGVMSHSHNLLVVHEVP